MEDDELKARKLISGIAQGDSSSLSALHDAYSTPLFSFALRIVHSPETATEVVQDTFLAVWRSAGNYDAGRSKVFSWLVMILRRKAIDRLRMESRRIPGPVSTEDSPVGEGTAPKESSPAIQAQMKDRSQQMAGLLKELPEDQRRPLELAFFEGRTHQEIAELLNEPLGTIKSRIRLGLTRLRNRLKEGAND